MRERILSTLLFLLVTLGVSPLGRAEVIASFQSDFSTETPADGWKYFWNSEAAIGTSAKYKPLVWNATANG